MIAGPLVATKLFVPRLRAGVVERQRLSARLDRGASAKLTLISAPAGFGKTTLVSAWLATRPAGDRAVAWLSLDQTDNNAMSFWAHAVAALQKAAASTGVESLPILEPGQHPIDVVLTSIVNALSGLPNAIDLVLDDYHVIDDTEVQAGVEFLLEHLPENAHLILITRADPALPLARLRARGELVEIRSADLRFSADETTAYLNGTMALGLGATDALVLGDRTEGWIAALQLAALSMQGRDDRTSFIAGFAGTDRYVFDYLVEEVLGRQSEDIRSFLLETCFLERLSGPLCDAVTGRSDGKRMLEALYRANLFLIPLDDRREWYRYHHLFADVLLTQFAEDLRELLPVLHRRASLWYAQHGDPLEAIRHALAGGDFEHAAGLMELALPDMQRNRGEAIIRGWAHALPAELVRLRPVLGIGLVGGVVSFGEFDGIEDRLRDVERGVATLAEVGEPRVVVVDKTQLPRVPGAVELYRAALAQIRGDVPGLIEHAQRVLELAPLEDHLSRAAGSSMLGIAYWSGGKLEAARRAWTVGRNGLQRTGHIADMLGVSIAIADINFAQGQLREATKICEQALQLSAAEAGPALRGTADMHAGLSGFFRERNELAAAHQHLAKSQELGERAGLPQHPYRWRVAAAHLRHVAGNFDAAITLLDEAERLYVSDFFPYVRPVAAMRARVWLAQGRLDEALRWQRDSGVGVDDELSYLREFEHITLARLLLAQPARGQGDGTLVAFLDRLLEAADRGGRGGSVIEIAILQAVALRQTDIDAALVGLERALTLAAPEGYVRLFVNEGQPMATLLKLAAKRRVMPAYARALLAAFGPPEATTQVQPDLIEPLSERELDVLRLLRSDMGGPDIARELGVSENTMRTHTKNIYEKLGVNNRRSAVRRAEELQLLARNPSR